MHVILKQFFIEKAGEDAWTKFLEKNKLTEYDFESETHYKDETTTKLLNMVSEALAIPIFNLNEALGSFFLDFHVNSKNAGIVKGLGDNFTTFMNNLNDMHFMQKGKYEHLVAPTFRCNVVGDGMVSVNYYSMREGYIGLTQGLLNAICKKIFHIDVIITVDDRPKVGLGRFKEHIIFCVRTMTDDPLSQYKLMGPEQEEGRDSEVQLLTDEEWCENLPFHFFFNSHMDILQMGYSIRRLCNVKPEDTLKVTDIFKLIEPPVKFEFKNILKHLNSPFLLEGIPQPDKREKEKKTPKAVILAGKMIAEPGDCEAVFVGCPHALQLEDLFDGRLHVSDLPLSDCSQAALAENHHIAEEEELRLKIEETEEEILHNQTILSMKKSSIITDCLQMLPPSVKASVRQGKNVDARKYESATALVLDIPTFGDILPKLSPSVSVNILNESYRRFDELTEKFEVFKVRASGEQYLVVGGVPDVTEDHAVRLCALSLEMMQTVKLVPQPQMNTPIKIRIGIYSGPVFTMLLGEQVPRYCVFGEAVNKAELLMKLGVPGKIHIAEATALLLEEHDFRLCERGDMKVGNLLTATYLLFGYKDHVFEDLKCTRSTMVDHQTIAACCPRP